MNEESIMNVVEELIGKKPQMAINPAKTACFGIGLLASKVSYEQKQRLGSEPIKAILKDFKLSQKDIKRCYKELNSKLNSYNTGSKDRNVIDKHTANILEMTASNLIKSEDEWTLRVAEIGYYVALGMNLSDVIRKKSFENNKVEVE